MYVRPSSPRTGSVKLPENYSGNAFPRQSVYSEMPPPARAQTTHQDNIKHERPANLDIPPEDIREEFAPPTYHEIEDEPTRDHVVPRQPNSQSSIFSSLLPKGTLSTHFPFGHGIGSEELLILAVMLLVFLSGSESGETDSEFILLLGLLLFAG